MTDFIYKMRLYRSLRHPLISVEKKINAIFVHFVLLLVRQGLRVNG